jgi:hypothetical protein
LALPAARRALEQLQTVAESIRQQPPAPQPPKPPAPAGQKPPAAANPQDQARAAQQARALQLAIAQLKLVRRMQADLEARTNAMEQSVAAGRADAAAVKAQSARLAAEQRELAELAESVVRDADVPPMDEESSP